MAMNCNRCGTEYNFDDNYDEETYELLDGDYQYCPCCNSCQECGCCPCNKDDCYWCCENVAYEKIRQQLLLWASAYKERDRELKKEPQRLMAELRKSYYRDGGCYVEK